MASAPLPLDEKSRVRRLHELGILDTPPDQRFDAIARRALALFPGAPIAAVSLVDTDRQWFKSILGLPVTQTGRDVSFCAYTVLGSRVMVVEDAAQDRRFADNALVLNKPGVRFYAGAPLLEGLGSLCVIDTQPRRVGRDEVAELARLARYVDCLLLMHGALQALERSQPAI